MYPPQTCSLAESLALLPESDREQVLKGLSNDECNALLYDWRGMWARPSQVQPEGDWLFWLLLAGRGYGKTKTGGETVREWASKPLDAPIHLIAPTAGDIRNVMIEGPSGILSCYPPDARPLYQPSQRHKITWANGNIAYGFSADEPERLRGPQCCRFWADEFASWRYIQEAWDNLMFGFRVGEDLRGVITTTPKPVKQLRELVVNPASAVTRGSTYENRANLSPKFFEQVVTRYEGTRLGRQELLAEILTDKPGALWKRLQIDALRIRLQDVRFEMVIRIVVAVDPAVTSNENSDETGIIVAGLTRSQHVLIFDDVSLVGTPLEWAVATKDAFTKWRGDRVVAEVNNGGDLVAQNIRAVAPNIPYRAVRAARGKAKRAEPVSALYEQGRVHHVGFFAQLEEQMCEFSPLEDAGTTPDDRMDALVWAVHELLIDQEDVTSTVVLNDPTAYRISPV